MQRPSSLETRGERRSLFTNSAGLSVLQVVLADPLGRQLGQNVVQVVEVGVAVAREVGAKLCFVVDLVPHHRVRLSRGAGGADGEDEASVPRHDQQLQDLNATDGREGGG